MLQHTFPAGFIAPCLPTKTTKLPSGSQWLHEIKHDGFRIIARKSEGRVRLYSRPGNDFTRRFPLIVEALAPLRAADSANIVLIDIFRLLVHSGVIAALLSTQTPAASDHSINHEPPAMDQRRQAMAGFGGGSDRMPSCPVPKHHNRRF